jgi:hypothetical protein
MSVAPVILACPPAIVLAPRTTFEKLPLKAIPTLPFWVRNKLRKTGKTGTA